MIWIDGQILHGTLVEKQEIKRPGGATYYSIPTNTQVGVLHTTEGKTLSSALAQLEMAHDAPHFAVGENRIVQCRPIGVQAAALRANQGEPNPNMDAYIQIENVAFSSQQLYLPDASTLTPLVRLLAYLTAYIPLTVPNNWPDDCSDMKGEVWSSNNSRRKAAMTGLWPKEKGWWMHMEVPYQRKSWHWDCGAIKRSVILQQAKDLK